MSKAPIDSFLQPYSIGLKLRTLRAEKRLTLARLGAETGFSTALLSKLETDRMIPTISTLARLCQVYGVGLGYFFSDATHHSLSISRKAHLSHHGREQATATRIPLHVPTARSSMFVRVLDLPTGLPSNVGESGARTELFAYVLEGRLQLTTAGSNEVLETGDCVVLDTDEPAVWSALGESPCRVLSISARTSPE